MKEIKVFAGVSFSFFLAFSAAATGLVSCGDDDKPSESEIRNLCIEGCNKFKTCNPGLPIAVDCTAQCSQQTPGSGSAETCTNAAEIVAKSKECIAKSCAELEACLDAVPECRMAGTNPGTGGTTATPGAGGTSGTPTLPGSGGRTGTSDAGAPPADGGSTAGCEECMRAQTCIEAVSGDAGIPGGAGGQNYAQTCAMAAPAQREQIVMGCRLIAMTLCR